MCGRSGVNVIKLCTKFDRDRSIRGSVIYDLANFFKAVYFQTLLIRGVGQTASDFGRTELHHALLRFEMRAAQRRVVSKIETKFHAF